jgi:hypothetical protein
VQSCTNPERWQALSTLDAQSHTVGISIKCQTLARTEEGSISRGVSDASAKKQRLKIFSFQDFRCRLIDIQQNVIDHAFFFASVTLGSATFSRVSHAIEDFLDSDCFRSAR